MTKKGSGACNSRTSNKFNHRKTKLLIHAVRASGRLDSSFLPRRSTRLLRQTKLCYSSNNEGNDRRNDLAVHVYFNW